FGQKSFRFLRNAVAQGAGNENGPNPSGGQVRMADSTQTVHSAQASEEQVRFVADARLISVLGEQLIGSEKVGILELVKNAYDAGATICTVVIEGAPGLKPEARSAAEYQDLPGPIIEIRDDGSGMSHDVLVEGWLRPATPS